MFDRDPFSTLATAAAPKHAPHAPLPDHDHLFLMTEKDRRIPFDLQSQNKFLKRKLENNEGMIEGQWTFRGYYPSYCKQLPPCYASELQFEFDTRLFRKNYKCYITQQR